MGECHICLEMFVQDELEGHRETCSAWLMFRCAVCKLDYVSMEGIWNHLVTHQIADASKEYCYQELRVTYNLHKCMLCNDRRAYSASMYWNHVHEDHDGFFLRCWECGENFRSERLCTDHALNHCKARKASALRARKSAAVKLEPSERKQSTVPVENGESSLGVAVETLDDGIRKQITKGQSTCDLCNRFFTKPSYYDYHMLTFHSDPQHQCPKCPRKFHLKDTLQRHVNEHAEEQIAAESESISVDSSGRSSALAQGNESNESEKMDDFNSDTSSGQEYEASSNTSSEYDLEPSCQSSQVNCPHCSKPFALEASLIKHIDRIHKSITCDICALSISGKNHLYNHMLTSHYELQYKCLECPKQFDRKVPYRRHLHKHLLEQKFSCDSCTQTFRSSTALDLHKEQNQCVTKIKNDVQEQSPLSELFETKCPYCGKQCNHAKFLVNHILNMHQPLSCEVCRRTFKGEKRFHNHKVRHMKPQFECPYCRNKFPKKNQYDHHLSAHHECSCGSIFKNLVHLRAHKTRTHPAEVARTARTSLTNTSLVKLVKTSLQSQGLLKDHLDDGDIATKEKTSLLKRDENHVSEDDWGKSPSNGDGSGDEAHLAQHDEDAHQSLICETCGMCLDNSDLLQHHMVCD